MSLTPGTRLGPYEVVARIGGGGMGDVYKATDTRLGRTVALKVSRAEFSERFEREARAVAALNHSHICQLYDVGPNYLVMEFVYGGPVQPLYDRARLLDLAAQVADALVAAHAAGIVHRDGRPAMVAWSCCCRRPDRPVCGGLPQSRRFSNSTRTRRCGSLSSGNRSCPRTGHRPPPSRSAGFRTAGRSSFGIPIISLRGSSPPTAGRRNLRRSAANSPASCGIWLPPPEGGHVVRAHAHRGSVQRTGG